MTSFERDWGRFLDGRYSQLSPHLKERIRYYYGPNSGEYAYMETYIYPEQFFGVYAYLLNVDEAIIRQVGELCNVYDLDQETYRGLTQDAKLKVNLPEVKLKISDESADSRSDD
jgi:hypothetical protein